MSLLLMIKWKQHQGDHLFILFFGHLFVNFSVCLFVCFFLFFSFKMLMLLISVVYILLFFHSFFSLSLISFFSHFLTTFLYRIAAVLLLAFGINHGKNIQYISKKKIGIFKLLSFRNVSSKEMSKLCLTFCSVMTRKNIKFSNQNFRQCYNWNCKKYLISP